MNLQEIIEAGAIIVDVRTAEEFKEGNIKGSINIPLDKIEEATSWLIKDVPIITCCASGSRSEMAKIILENNGYKEVYNGGAWNDLGKMGVGGSCPVK